MTIADPLVMPALQQVLTQLMSELATTGAGQPAHARITPGTEVAPSLTQFVNECCEGVASVRATSAFPTDDFPNQDSRPILAGGPVAGYAVDVEVMVLRCGSQPGQDMDPSDAQLTADAQTQWDDYAAMRRAAYRLPLNAGAIFDVTIGQYQPVAGDGGCLGGTLSLQIHVDCKEV